MKCVMCGKGPLEERVVEYKEFGVSLGRFKGQVCSQCGESYFDSGTAKRIQSKSKEMGLFGLAKKTKVAQVGNSLAIRIPKEIVQFLHLKKEEEVRLVPKGPHELSIEM